MHFMHPAWHIGRISPLCHAGCMKFSDFIVYVDESGNHGQGDRVVNGTKDLTVEVGFNSTCARTVVSAMASKSTTSAGFC